MSHKKFGPDRFSRFDVYWIQINKQTDKAKFIYRCNFELYIFFTYSYAESWKSYQLIREHVVFLFTFDTCDVVRSWSNFLLPSIVLDNLFDFQCSFFRQYYRKKFENADEMQKKNFILQGRQNKSGFDYPVKKKRMKDLSLIKKILS